LISPEHRGGHSRYLGIPLPVGDGGEGLPDLPENWGILEIGLRESE
jgi:hypothetical protein